MKRICSLALAGLLTVSSLPALAGTDSGLYLGLGVGQADVGDLDIENQEIDFDGDDTAYKAFVGFNFGWIPLIDLAVEGGYVDFGKADDGGVTLDTDGFDLFGLGGLSFGPFGVFVKAGMISWDADVSSDGFSAGDDGTDPAYGIGARFAIGSFQIRGEWEYFDIDATDDLNLLSLSGIYTF